MKPSLFSNVSCLPLLLAFALTPTALADTSDTGVEDTGAYDTGAYDTGTSGDTAEEEYVPGYSASELAEDSGGCQSLFPGRALLLLLGFSLLRRKHR